MLKYSINYKFLLTTIILIIILAGIFLYFKFINNNVFGKEKENFEGSPYLYYKWEIVKRRGNDNSVQVSEFTFYDSNKNPITINPSNVRNPNGNNPVGEEPKNLVDNNVRTKWLDFNFAQNGNNSSVIFNMGSNSLLPMYYSWHTANDTTYYPNRNPISWRVYGSNENNVWIKLSEINDYSVVIDNYRIVKLDNYDNNTNYFQLTYPTSNRSIVLLPDTTINVPVTRTTIVTSPPSNPNINSVVLLPDFLSESANLNVPSFVSTTSNVTSPSINQTINYSADNINAKVNETLGLLKKNDISGDLASINESLDTTTSLLDKTQTRVIPSISKTSDVLNYPNNIIKTENSKIVNATGELTPLLTRKQMEELNRRAEGFENITPNYTPSPPLAFNPLKSNNLNIPNNKIVSNKQNTRITRKDKNLFMNSYIPPKIDDFEKAEKDWKKEWDYNLKELKVSFPNIGNL